VAYKTLTLKNAIKKNLLTKLTTDVESLAEEDGKMQVRIYEGDTTLEGAVDLTDLFQEENTAGIIVNGNLTVHGTIIDFELDTISSFLIVNGSLTCTNLVAGCAEILVHGNVTVADAMVGFYNHGHTEVDGDLRGRLLVVDEHNTTIHGTIHAATFCRGWQIQAADYSDWRDVLVPDVAEALLEEDGYLSAGDTRLLQLLKDGKPVFREDLGVSAANNPAPLEVGWIIIKSLVKDLACAGEEYPFAVMEQQSPGLPGAKFLLYDGTVVLDTLDLNREDYLAIVVTGNLYVTGNILNEDTDSGCSLIVLGNLRAQNVYAGGQLIYVGGYTAVKELLLGVYNHGEFNGNSYVWCPVIVSSDFRFQFTDYARARVLDLWNEDDKDIAREKLIDDLFDEDENFLHYSVIRAGGPLLKAPVVRGPVTVADILAYIEAPLMLSYDIGVRIEEDDWTISLHRGGPLGDDPYGDAPSILAMHARGSYYQWCVMDEQTVEATKKIDEVWSTVSADEAEANSAIFAQIEVLLNRRLRWNNRYARPFDQTKVWDLMWMFNNPDVHDDDAYQTIANNMYHRIMRACVSPSSYVFSTYPKDSDHHDLRRKPTRIAAFAFYDALVENGLAHDIPLDTPLTECTEVLFASSQYHYGRDIEIPERYASQPIDRFFLIEANAVLEPDNGAYLRLDMGLPLYVLTATTLDDVPELIATAQSFGAYVKYPILVKEKEELVLKKTAGKILDIAQEDPAGLSKYRKHQETIWAYAYHDRGDVDFWPGWMAELLEALIDQAGVDYIDRGKPDAEPLPDELEHWLAWCEEYAVMRKACE
jgi:hypothetical protein